MVGSVGVGGFPPSLSGLGGHKALPFDKVDTDSNGAISLEEFTAALNKLPSAADSAASDTAANDLFKQIDTDGDGQISKDEASAFKSKLSAQLQAMMLLFQEQNGTDAAATAQAGVTGPSADDIFTKLDADGNGSISKDEFTAALQNRHQSDGVGDRAAKLFDKIDTNGDGSISKDENQAFLEKMQAHGGHHHHRHAWLSRLASQSYADASTVSTEPTDASTTTTESQTA